MTLLARTPSPLQMPTALLPSYKAFLHLAVGIVRNLLWAPLVRPLIMLAATQMSFSFTDAELQTLNLSSTVKKADGHAPVIHQSNLLKILAVHQEGGTISEASYVTAKQVYIQQNMKYFIDAAIKISQSSISISDSFCGFCRHDPLSDSQSYSL